MFLCPLIILSIFNSVEFYVITVVIAAAVIAYASGGNGGGPTRQYLLPGVLAMTDEGRAPSIELICCDDGSVVLRRHGLEGMTLSGAVSLAINVVGFDVRIKERVVSGKRGDTETVDTASFVLDFMGAEHYFINYTAEDAGLFAAVTLHNRPGIRVVKNMQ